MGHTAWMSLVGLIPILNSLIFGVPVVVIVHALQLSPPIPPSWLLWHFNGGHGRAWFKAAVMPFILSSFLSLRRIDSSIFPIKTWCFFVHCISLLSVKSGLTTPHDTPHD